jgi:UDP-N-acetylglucosamine diphosphorylase/glucosamine-1-phosphate N-acetyltransferase
MSVSYDNIAIIILAAGEGKRMKSAMAKVLHAVAGRTMISHVVDTAVEVAGRNVVVVVGHQAEKVKETVSKHADALFAYQSDQRGTGHAVQCALPFLLEECRAAVILCGDVPLITTATIRRLIDKHLQHGNDVTLLAVTVENPFGYGRVIRSETGNVEAIVEEADATADEKQIDLINSGVYCVNKNFLERSLPQIKSANAQRELYLTDIIKIGRLSGKQIGLLTLEDSAEVMGINTIEDLQRVEAVLKARNWKMS